mmetsp:Transcript_42101/g.101542  ORF Transcript_42101/g.101542 Transcript_42101/m.101542 type:complete len:1109 (-) Transcript_42101:236-3562(-)
MWDIVGWCWIGLFSVYIVQSLKDDSVEENDAISKVRQLVPRDRIVGTEYNLLTNHPQHAFFDERRLAQSSPSTRSESYNGEDQLSLKGSTYDPKKVHASAGSAAFVGMQLHIFRRDRARREPQHLSDGNPVVSEGKCHEVEARKTADIDQPGDEDDRLVFFYEKAYQLTEAVSLELGVPPRHNLDYAYKPVIPQDKPFTQQPESDENDDDSDSTADTLWGHEDNRDPEKLSCTDVSPIENVFSNWWKWWLPWSHNEWWKNHGSKRSDYKMGNSAFAGGSHGEIWRGRRICHKGSSVDCDDQKPFILKRLRVEKGYRLLEAGLREIYMGNWILHELQEAQQSLYTTYVDHFFREIPVKRSFGLYQNTKLELWIVFEDAGPSLRSYIYDTVTSQGGGFVMYQPSRLWSSLRSFRGKSDHQDSSLSVNLRDGKSSQSEDTNSSDQSKQQLTSRGNGGDILRTVLQHILSSAALLHENGKVHRDIKPSNVMCSTKNPPSYDWNGVPQLSNIECRLGDFSSAWDNDYIATNLYTKGPSPAEQTDEYAPPESYISDEWVPFDKERPQSYDSWSVGVLALELLLGTPNVFTVDQRTTALLTNKMKKENASDEEIQRALYLAALSQFCIYMPSNTGNNNPKRNSTGPSIGRSSWPLRHGDPLHKTPISQQSCTMRDFHHALRARDPLGLGFDSSADLLLHLIWQLLAWDPNDRITAAEALLHPYFSSPDGSLFDSLEWDTPPATMFFPSSDPRLDVSPATYSVDEFVCPKCGRSFSDWRSCHAHVNGRKHGRFCTYDRTSLPTCINTHSMLPAHPTSGYCDLQGRRSVIEDFHSIQLEASVQFYGIFDGHTGNLASKYVASTMYDQLLAHLHLDELSNLTRTESLPTIWKEEIRGNVSEAFAQIHEEFVERTSRITDSTRDRSGTTATSLLVTEDVVVVSSIGDSRAVLSSMNESGKMTAIPLTKDHVASDPDERNLVIEKGGFVSSSGGIDRVNGTLAITRSIGDVGLAPLLSRVPHVASFTHDEIRDLCGANQQQSMPCFVVLASDGLWDVMSNQEAVDMVAVVIASYDATDRVSWNNGGAFQEAAEVLAVDAYVRGSNDNIGVCVVALLPGGR